MSHGKPKLLTNVPAANKHSSKTPARDRASKGIVRPKRAELVLVKTTLPHASSQLSQPDPGLRGVADAIISVGEQRAKLLEKLRAAVQSQNKDLVFKLAQQYCGVCA